MIRGLVCIFFLPALAFAETDGDVKPLFEAYAKERGAAKAPADTLAAADRLAARAEEARKAENYAGASRLIRDARWSLPAFPAELPAGVRVLGYNRLRHGERANAVHYNRDGSLLLSCSSDRTVRVWDVATGREVMVYRGHTAANTDEDARSGISGVPLRVTDAAFLPDGKRVVSAGGKQIHIWDLKTGKTLSVLKVDGSEKAKPGVLLIKSIAVSSDGKTLVSGSDDKIVRLWNLETGKETFAGAPQSSRIECVAYQPKGKLVAAVDADGFLGVYDPTGENKSPLMKLQITDGGSVSAYAVRFTPDGTKLLTGGADRAPRLTPAPGPDGAVPPNLAAGTQKLPPHDGEVLAVDVTADGKYFASAGRDKAVRLVDSLGQIVRSFNSTSPLTALAVRPDGLQVAASCEDGSVRVWDFLPVDDNRSASEAKEPLWAAAVNADGTMFAAAGADKVIRIYALNCKLLHSLEGSAGAVTGLAFLAENKLLSAGGDKVLRLWDAKAGKPLGEWPGHTAAVLALAATPDGRIAVSGAADKIVNAWNTETGKIIWTWTARSAVTALAITKDGQRVVVGTADGGMSVLNIDKEKPSLVGYANAHISGVASLAFNADAIRLVSAGGDGVPKIWSLPESGPPQTLHRMKPALPPTTPAPVALSAAAFSPDGRQVAIGGADKIVRLYDAATGQEVRSLRGCTDWVTALAYTPDGERLVAVSADKAARVFDVARIDAGLHGGHASSANAVAISKDGKLLASVGDDHTIRFWDRATGAEAGTIACPGDKLFSIAFAGTNRLATGGSDSKLRVWNLQDKKELSATPTGAIYGITAAPDGSQLGVWSHMGEQHDAFSLYPVDGKAAPNTIVEKTRKVKAAAFAADLSLVASGDDKGIVVLHDLTTKEAVGKEWPICWHWMSYKPVADLGFSPDRKLLLVIDGEGTVTINDVATRKTVAAAKGPNEGIFGLIIAPAGNRFALLGVEGNAMIFDYEGKELKAVMLPSPAKGACFSADGKTLFTANADGSLYAIDLP